MFHVLNRGVGRMRLFLKDADFEAFERTIEKTLESRPMRICAYCLMSKAATSPFRWNRTTISTRWCVLPSGTLCERISCLGHRTGVGQVSVPLNCPNTGSSAYVSDAASAAVSAKMARMHRGSRYSPLRTA